MYMWMLGAIIVQVVIQNSLSFSPLDMYMWMLGAIIVLLRRCSYDRDIDRTLYMRVVI
jgi:hypothetical protein